MAVKTGMLYSTEIIRVVARFFKRFRRIPLVVDPVMIATSGARLLNPSAMTTLRKDLLPLASLVTPNLDEAAMLVGRPLRSVEAMRLAARTIHGDFGCAVLVKGGHLRGMQEAVDIFYDGRVELLLTAPFIRGPHCHGTGCTYSAAITAWLARGLDLPGAVSKAKEEITQAIVCSRRAAGHPVLNHLWRHGGG